MTVQFAKISQSYLDKIWPCVSRYYDGDRLSFEMDMCACEYTNPIDWDRLSAADDFDLLHDVLGIRRHMNRRTGQLEDCFVPRFSKPQ